MAAALHRLLAAAIVLLSLQAAQGVEKKRLFPAIFVFGDSLADNGNNNFFLTLARADMPPNGIDFPSGPTGRFCNGKTIIDVLCDFVALPYPPPSLAPTTTGPIILTGVNYASAAGGILASSGRNYIDNMPLLKQLQHFNVTLDAIRKQLGVANATKHVSDSMFAIVIGSNDYINNYYINSTTRSRYTTREYREVLISSLENNFMTLYSMGARKFVVSGLGPLGCIPSELSRRNSTGECVESVNHMVTRYNLALRKSIKRMNSKLRGAKLIYTDAYRALLEIIHAPSSFGFENVNSGCCGAGKFNAQLPCYPLISTVCKHRSSYVFWDAFHPTEAVNVLLGAKFFNGSQSYARPINIQRLASV
ncbi:GDSL esterase/lipase At1g71691 [Selaginella moellendorffii]|uniref:GDSL esterase/lipase At1g71691 n=1 Tax=Selaginella moellendorffii TaxID=88036 RepID=UPI000D1CB15D|nr:GDSL esterase/lipase At1g71691 [Selaginella moellendorffii]|eukprot:XP_024534466.1 GDSL esterase/lipase At1g71691 [Selaginella moellendorffii]